MSAPGTVHDATRHLFLTTDLPGGTRLMFGDPRRLEARVIDGETRIHWSVRVDAFVGAPYIDSTWLAFVERVVRQFFPQDDPIGPISIEMAYVIPQPASAAGRPRRDPSVVRFWSVRRTQIATAAGSITPWRDRGVHVDFLMP